MKIWLTLKAFLVVSFLLPTLSGCNSETLTLAEGGIGGSGVMMGNITGFGSIHVNGVRYETAETVFYRDGQLVADQSDFKLGENIKIYGEIDTETGLGVAQSIAYNSALIGVVTSTIDDNVIEIMGQTVVITPLTVFHGANNALELTLGKYVEVSGSWDSQGDLIAGSMRMIVPASSDVVLPVSLEGEIASIDTATSTLVIRDITVDYATAVSSNFLKEELRVGQYLEVVSDTPMVSPTKVLASSISLRDRYDSFPKGVPIEIKGLVTYFNSPFEFSIEGQAVALEADVPFSLGRWQDISLDSMLVVKGEIDETNTLVATDVSIVEVKPDVITDLVTFIGEDFILLQSDIVFIDAATLFVDDSYKGRTALNFEDLVVGDFVQIATSVDDEHQLTALRVDVIDAGYSYIQ